TRRVGARRSMRDGLLHVALAAHPAIEVVRGAPGDELVKAGIDEVGADLEGLDRQAPPTKRLEQPERDGGLADSARRARDDRETRRARDRAAHPRSSREDRFRWHAPGQVSWLPDRPTPRAFPALTPVAFCGFRP